MLTSMTFVFFMAACTVAAFLVVSLRVVTLDVMLRYSVVIDVVFTMLVALAFMGTLTGMLVAVVSGLMLSMYFTAMKWITGKAAKVKAAVKPRQEPAKVDPFTIDLSLVKDDHFPDGTWVYNHPVYTRGMEGV